MNDLSCEFVLHLFFAKGGDLDLKIQSRKATGKPFELSLILDWFVQLTNAVRYIHERCGTIFNAIKLTMVS